jgi:hypothetical protein
MSFTTASPDQAITCSRFDLLMFLGRQRLCGGMAAVGMLMVGHLGGRRWNFGMVGCASGIAEDGFVHGQKGRCFGKGKPPVLVATHRVRRGRQGRVSALQ